MYFLFCNEWKIVGHYKLYAQFLFVDGVVQLPNRIDFKYQRYVDY